MLVKVKVSQSSRTVVMLLMNFPRTDIDRERGQFLEIISVM